MRWWISPTCGARRVARGGAYSRRCALKPPKMTFDEYLAKIPRAWRHRRGTRRSRRQGSAKSERAITHHAARHSGVALDPRSNARRAQRPELSRLHSSRPIRITPARSRREAAKVGDSFGRGRRHWPVCDRFCRDPRGESAPWETIRDRGQSAQRRDDASVSHSAIPDRRDL